ncbi:MAG TPA: MobF family relaxase [Acidimicrobiia bacterium]|nr:MobF family relaxase [Acidimicrobiia bacterium]
MTVRVTTLKGAAAGRYYTSHLPSYYLDGDEPPGRWWGLATERLGLNGEIAADLFHAVIDGKHPTTGADLGRRFGDGSVRGFDATFSAPKSVSVLFGLGDETIRDQVVEAHDASVDSVLGWIQHHAHTRMRIHGHVMCVDSDGIVAAVFRQHTSRRLDPQLHTHAVIANRVLAPDGRWLALDARTIKVDQRTLSALYHASLRAELTGRLGVRWREVEHGIAEIADMPVEVLAEFSQRSTDIDERIDAKLARFRHDLGRHPTPAERWRLEREAVTDSRPAKRHGITSEELRQEWQYRVQELGLDPHDLVQTSIGRRTSRDQIDPTLVVHMVGQAVETLEADQSSWRSAEVLRELAATFPTTVPANAERLTGWLQTLTDHTIEHRCVDLGRLMSTATPLRRDGRPITEAAVDRRLTTQAILDQEERLIKWAEHRFTEPSSIGRVEGRGLDPGQVEVAGTVAGHRRLEIVEGPAGTGKTTALGAAVASLQAQHRHVFGVAPTAAAAEVLGAGTGMDADTLDKLLVEHSLTQHPPRPEYDLAAGTTVIVDEAGTASTPALAQLADLADRKDWRVVFVGDPRQFSAVGRGGMFAHLVNQYGAVELDQVHRFRNDWERKASLQLRAGDPGALADYEQHGRLHGGSAQEMESKIIATWAAARSRGETVALMANSNQAVNRLNQLAQATRFMDGDISIQKGRLRIGEEVVCVGDEVVTRRNDRTLRTSDGVIVKNRDRWVVQTIHPDRNITVAGANGTIRLPADYVASHLRIGYAQTSHATQGRTVDTALLLIDSPTDHAGVYTPMTRGRDANHAYVITEDTQTALDVVSQAISRDWIDQPAVARKAQLDPTRPWELTSPGDDDQIDRLVDHSQRVIQVRRARGPRSERSLGVEIDR